MTTRWVSSFTACALGVLALAGCTWTSEREEHLPWLLKKSTHTAFGNFSGNSESSWFVKHWGFWRSIDAWNVVVLDPEHVIVWNEEGHGLLERGALRAVQVCPKLASVSVPPGAPALDCVEGATHADGDLTGVRWRRFDPSGGLLEERIFRASGAGRVFVPPARVFAYDAAGLPYFLCVAAARRVRGRKRPTLPRGRHRAPQSWRAGLTRRWVRGWSSSRAADAAALCYRRSARPPRSPVSAPPSSATTPLTSTSSTPSL